MQPQEMNNEIDNPDLQKRVFQLRSRLENWFVNHVNTELDGIREPVPGKGQLNRAGLQGCNQKQYNQR